MSDNRALAENLQEMLFLCLVQSHDNGWKARSGRGLTELETEKSRLLDRHVLNHTRLKGTGGEWN